jgi:hypothetical protein
VDLKISVVSPSEFFKRLKKENRIKTCEVHGRKVIKALGNLINGNNGESQRRIEVNSQLQAALTNLTEKVK